MNRSKRTTSKQFEILIDFLEKHPELHLPPGKNSENFTITVGQRRALWDELTCCLNSTLSGPQKSCNKWQKTWSDFKHFVHVKASRSLKQTETFSQLNDLEHRVIQMCKWNSRRGGSDNNSNLVLEEEFAVDEPENNSTNEEGYDYLSEVPSTSSTVAEEEIIVPNILYVSNVDNGEAKVKKEKKPDVTLEDIKERLETQNNLITEGIHFVREIAKSQNKIADAELLKAQAFRDIASTFRDFLEGFKK